MEWEGFEWQIGERWGIVHPEKPICYSGRCPVCNQMDVVQKKLEKLK